MLKKKELDNKEMEEILMANDFVILRCLLNISFNGEEETSMKKDEKTRDKIINFLETNNKIMQFTESMLSHLRDPNNFLTKINTLEQKNEVLREDKEDTWFMCCYIKKIAKNYLKNVILSTLDSIDKESKKTQNSTQVEKIDRVIDVCSFFVKNLWKHLHLLPRSFFSLFSVVVNHYSSSPRDSVVSILFLRIFYFALLNPSFIKDNQNQRNFFSNIFFFF